MSNDAVRPAFDGGGVYLASAAMTMIPPGSVGADAIYWGAGIFAVADGADDQSGSGQRALFEVLRQLGSPPSARPLRSALEAANRTLSNPQGVPEAGVAAVTVALWTGTGFVVGHVGDTRAYHVRGGVCTQLGTDQRSGSSAEPDMGVARLGQPHAVDQAQVVVIETLPGDRLVLCTDGVWRATTPDQLTQLVAGSPDQAAAALRAATTGRDAEDAAAVIIAVETLEAETAGATRIARPGSPKD